MAMSAAHVFNLDNFFQVHTEYVDCEFNHFIFGIKSHTNYFKKGEDDSPFRVFHMPKKEDSVTNFGIAPEVFLTGLLMLLCSYKRMV